MSKDLFIKYLQGTCTEEEFDRILFWIREESQSNIGKGMVQEIWDEYEPCAEPVERMKYNRILDKIHHQININQNVISSASHKYSVKKRILTVLTRVAAILLLPVLILLLYTNRSFDGRYMANTGDLEIEAPAGSRIHVEMGDGTKVWLNHGSKLRYPYRFDGVSRKVYLVGEAYFEVAHNAKVPFIVGTNSVNVKAVGTAFNVSAYPDDGTVETTLVEGIVILHEKDNYSEIKTLLPGECLKFDAKKKSYSLEVENTSKYTLWKDGMLVFKNDNVEDVARKLARWYNIEVEIADQKIKGYPFTATFTDETLPQVLELLSMATPVSYQLTASKKLSDGSFSKQKVLIGLKKL